MATVLVLPPAVKIFLATEPTDMRKSHDGLCVLVKKAITDVSLFSGHFFVFVSKRGDRMKILTWDHGGFALWYKRLESGRFKIPPLPAGQATLQLDRTQFMMILEGIDATSVRRSKRWEPPPLSPQPE